MLIFIAFNLRYTSSFRNVFVFQIGNLYNELAFDESLPLGRTGFVVCTGMHNLHRLAINV